MANFSKCGCDLCGAHLEFPDEAAGATIACPHCQGQTTLRRVQQTLEHPANHPGNGNRRFGRMAAILLLVLVAGSLAGWAALKKFSASKTQHRTVTSVPPAGAQEPFALSKESVSSEPSRRSNGLVATVGEIKKGRDVYMGKCAKCHQFYDPAAYNDFDWNNWMGKMRGEAKLNGDQSELLNRFLGTIRNP